MQSTQPRPLLANTWLILLGTTLLAGRASAQGTPFQTPGMPATPSAAGSQGDTGQTTRFSNAFNPAISFIVDGLASYADSEVKEERGFDFSLRALELGGQAWVDPSAWAYFTAATDGEELAVEEGAVHYLGLGEQTTLRAGRFFIDFGKQMQIHVHELRTVERPLALRAFLGEEVRGDGVQIDHWTAVGDATVLRGSLGLFSGLLPEEQEFFDESFARSAPVRKDADELALTARVTGFRDVGSQGVLQLGGSGRVIPEFMVETSAGGPTGEGFSNRVYGFDATYGHTDDTGLRKLTLGSELLWSHGDSGFRIDDPDGISGSGDESLGRLTEALFGYYAFVDYAWSASSSAGVQYSTAELALPSSPRAREVELYYSRQLSEFHRVRLGLSHLDRDDSSNTTAFMIQYTAFVGSHGHGMNW
jgi:hypothetical protein